MRTKRMTGIFIFGVLAFAGLLLLSSTGFSDDDEATIKFYEICIVREIARCEAKSFMLNSESQNLRAYAQLRVQKAKFLAEQKDRLIQELMGEQITLRRHSILVYLNSRFNEEVD